MNRTRTGWAVALAAAAVFVAPGSARAQGKALGLGDPAPKINVKTFIKGEPVTEFQKDKLYVVEFWATWCPPCRVSIPHLTELQKKYPAVTFIGVSVVEHDQAEVMPFVKQMGDKMNYRVAMDSLPESGDSQEGAMVKTWMDAAGRDTIPTAFIIDGSSKIAWIGRPMEMEKPLAAIVSGKWDTKAAAEEEQVLADLNAKLQAAQAAGDAKALLHVLEEGLHDHPNLEEQFGFPKFALLMQTGAAAKAAVYGQHLVDEVYKDDPEALTQIAGSVVDPAAKKPQPALAALALKAAQRADVKAEQKQVSTAIVLARAFFLNHQASKAVEAQQRAIQLAKGTELAGDPDLAKGLAQYKKAAAAGKPAK